MSLFLYPLDTVKKNMQLNGARGHLTNYKGSLDCLQKMSSSYGAASLYRGVHIYAVKEVLTAFTQLSIYEALFLKNNKEKKEE